MPNKSFEESKVASTEQEDNLVEKEQAKVLPSKVDFYPDVEVKKAAIG